jgi:hypothetical protein
MFGIGTIVSSTTNNVGGNSEGQGATENLIGLFSDIYIQ